MDRLDGKLKDEPDDADLTGTLSRAHPTPSLLLARVRFISARAFLRRHRTLLMTGRNLELDLREHEDSLAIRRPQEEKFVIKFQLI